MKGVFMAHGESGYPDKFYYRIGEVSRITGLKPHVLRYWEKEFNLHPRTRGSPQRRYRREDIERLLTIKKLLHDERYTIAGARKRLQELSRERREQIKMPSVTMDYHELLLTVKDELMGIKEVLD